ncbi:hypothetical protein AA313_de0205547 [Arthrobotrys entomopaga]|nr:hypothetical protein AA313_de0205547 [Arthrobotrys entomopaga]
MDECLARLLYYGSWYFWEKRYFYHAQHIAELAEEIILKTSGGSSSLLYSDILTVIAVVNLESSRYHEGLAHFRHALEIVKAHIKRAGNPGKKEMIHLANASNNVATGLLAIGSDGLLEASKLLEIAGNLKTTWTSEETEPSLFAEHYCNLGRLRCMQGSIHMKKLLQDQDAIWLARQMKEAISLSKKAVKLNRDVYQNTNMSRTTSFMDNLAFVYRASGRHEKASKTHRENLELRVQYLGEQVQDTALSYHFLAVEYCESGELEESQ